MAICTNIELLETVNVDTQILRVTLDGSTSALMVYDLAEAMKYLNKDVEVTYRKDIWNGNICDFINTLTEHAVVNMPMLSSLQKQKTITLMSALQISNKEQQQ